MTKSYKSIYKKPDFFSNLAKKSHYRSRSSLKLIEIQNKDRFIKRGDKVLDLGCSPGGWCQVSKDIVGERGHVIGVDKKGMKPIEGVDFIKKDIKEFLKKDFEKLEKVILPFDVVLSDIAPNISGISIRDDALMIKIIADIKFSIDYLLRKKGSALIKIFHGDGFKNLRFYMKSRFQKVRIRKPLSSRKNSRETYILGLEKRT